MIAIAIAFLFGVATTVYLSLRSPEVKVPEIIGKDRFEAEKILADADLNFRVRATRPSNQAKPGTVVFQLPRPGEVVKAGQTVAMDISREAKEGESPETVKPEESNTNSNSNSSNSNENKPRKPKNKNTNDNANGNSNTSTNKNANANRSTNSNRPNTNDTGNGNTNSTPRPTPRANSNGNSNSRPANSNQNVNRRPPAPRPTATPN